MADEFDKILKQIEKEALAAAKELCRQEKAKKGKTKFAEEVGKLVDGDDDGGYAGCRISNPDRKETNPPTRSNPHLDDEVEYVPWGYDRKPLLRGAKAIAEYLAGNGGCVLDYTIIRDFRDFYGMPTFSLPGRDAHHYYIDAADLEEWWDDFKHRRAPFKLSINALYAIFMYARRLEDALEKNASKTPLAVKRNSKTLIKLINRIRKYWEEHEQYVNAKKAKVILTSKGNPNERRV